jgi:hypothetical protein
MLALSTQLFAQVKFGLRGGINLSKEKYEESGISITSDNRVGLHAGIFIQIPVSEMLSFQPEFYYSQEGGQVKVNGITAKDLLDFVNLPLLLKITPTQKFNIVLGPQFGFLASAQSEIDGDKNDIEGVKSVNTSFVFGAGFNIADDIELFGRYQAGITNLNDDSNIDINVTLNTIQIGIAINLLNK